MGEMIAFPGLRSGCTRWRQATTAITLSARPACAMLAMALTDGGMETSPGFARRAGSRRQG